MGILERFPAGIYEGSVCEYMTAKTKVIGSSITVVEYGISVRLRVITERFVVFAIPSTFALQKLSDEF